MAETIGELVAKLIDIKIEVREGELKRKELIPEIVKELERRLESGQTEKDVSGLKEGIESLGGSINDLEAKVEKLEDE